MSWAKPKFFDSAYFYYDENEMPALKDGAPDALKKELEEFIEYHYRKDTGER